MKHKFSWYRFANILKLAPSMFLNTCVLFFAILCISNSSKSTFSLVLGIVLPILIVVLNIALYYTTTDELLESETCYRTTKDKKHKDYQKYLPDKYKKK